MEAYYEDNKATVRIKWGRVREVLSKSVRETGIRHATVAEVKNMRQNEQYIVFGSHYFLIKMGLEV